MLYTKVYILKMYFTNGFDCMFGDLQNYNLYKNFISNFTIVRNITVTKRQNFYYVLIKVFYELFIMFKVHSVVFSQNLINRKSLSKRKCKLNNYEQFFSLKKNINSLTIHLTTIKLLTRCYYRPNW